MGMGLNGVRAAMYGEMAASAAGYRPWSAGRSEWDAALDGATQFIAAGGFDDQTGCMLLIEALKTRGTGIGDERKRPVTELCERLAAEFRWVVRRQSRYRSDIL